MNDEGRVKIPGNEVLKNQEKVKKKDKEQRQRKGKKVGGRRERNW